MDAYVIREHRRLSVGANVLCGVGELTVLKAGLTDLGYTVQRSTCTVQMCIESLFLEVPKKQPGRKKLDSDSYEV